MARKKLITENVEKAHEQEQGIVLGPCSEKQRKVLTESSVDILIQGGSAGSGKSHLALLKALGDCQDPAARVLIVRLTYPQLMQPGGLIDSSKQLYRPFGAVWKAQQKEWQFKNGATITFKAMPDDLSELQGGQFTTVICDEGAEMKLEQILMLKSRLRSTTFKGKLQLMITCNPDRNSYLYDWVKFSLDMDTGIPKAGTEDIVRWFVILDNKIHWSDDPDELYERVGHGYIKGVNWMPSSMKYIPMNIYDNPVLMKNNPGYLANLLSMSRVNQLRFLKGSWTAVTEGSSVFNRAWVNKVKFAPHDVTGRVRSWDLAHSVPSEVYPDPDWTAGVKMSRTKAGRYVIEHVDRDRKLTDGVVKMLIDTSHNEDGLDVPVTIPKDNGGGKAATQFFIRALAEQGITVKGIPISGHTSKIQRFLPFCSMCEAGLVDIVEGDWNEDFFTELEHFQGIRAEKNDQVDACADAFNFLAKNGNIPDFVVPDLSKPSPIPTI
jgi:predicted phage terminase large subunit-like protein